MTSTELVSQDSGVDVTIEFDRTALDEALANPAGVESFIERCSEVAKDAQRELAGASARFIVAAASATLAAIEAGLIPASGRASGEQMDNGAWSERLTGRKYASGEVSRWRNAAKALRLGMDPNSREFGVVTQTPAGITDALDEAVKTLGKGKTDTKRAESIRQGVVKAVTSGDNGGNGSREVHDIRKLDVREVFANLTDRCKTASEAWSAAEDEGGRKTVRETLEALSKGAEALMESVEATLADIAAKANDEAVAAAE